MTGGAHAPRYIGFITPVRPMLEALHNAQQFWHSRRLAYESVMDESERSVPLDLGEAKLRMVNFRQIGPVAVSRPVWSCNAFSKKLVLHC